MSWRGHTGLTRTGFSPMFSSDRCHGKRKEKGRFTVDKTYPVAGAKVCVWARGGSEEDGDGGELIFGQGRGIARSRFIGLLGRYVRFKGVPVYPLPRGRAAGRRIRHGGNGEV